MHFLPFVDTIRGRWRNDVTRKRNDRTIRKLNASTWISWISKQIRDSVSHNSDFRCYLPSDPSEHVSFKVMFKLLNYARDSLVHVRPGKGEGSWIISPISLEAFSLSSFSLPFPFFHLRFFLLYWRLVSSRLSLSETNKQKKRRRKQVKEEIKRENEFEAIKEAINPRTAKAGSILAHANTIYRYLTLVTFKIVIFFSRAFKLHLRIIILSNYTNDFIF